MSENNIIFEDRFSVSVSSKARLVVNTADWTQTVDKDGKKFDRGTSLLNLSPFLNMI
jgi:hypothetical protein